MCIRDRELKEQFNGLTEKNSGLEQTLAVTTEVVEQLQLQAKELSECVTGQTEQLRVTDVQSEQLKGQVTQLVESNTRLEQELRDRGDRDHTIADVMQTVTSQHRSMLEDEKSNGAMLAGEVQESVHRENELRLQMSQRSSYDFQRIEALEGALQDARRKIFWLTDHSECESTRISELAQELHQAASREQELAELLCQSDGVAAALHDTGSGGRTWSPLCVPDDGSFCGAIVRILEQGDGPTRLPRTLR
eukprot:TRINITY_DN40052_c0_g1_i1.p1 TRINITY_DN40052_c0_g1~~TRINITY_DN40052_c0_g1_i1.p1  ORF type:complete len:249 (+),score=52.31 TRINITY_DN40052_c0_g1_i1:128-874(+)